MDFTVRRVKCGIFRTVTVVVVFIVNGFVSLLSKKNKLVE